MVEGIDPKFEKAWYHANEFMYKRIKDEKHLSVYLNDPQICELWSEEEQEFLADSWRLITTGEVVEEELSVDESRIYEAIEETVLEEDDE